MRLPKRTILLTFTDWAGLVSILYRLHLLHSLTRQKTLTPSTPPLILFQNLTSEMLCGKSYPGKPPEEVATEFYRTVNTWFPFICGEDFCQRYLKYLFPFYSYIRNHATDLPESECHIGSQAFLPTSKYIQFIYWLENMISRLPVSWDEAPTDLSLLFLSMMLIATNPQGQEGQKHHLPANLNSCYLSLRSWIAVLEGLGFSSLDFLYARALIALFEFSHGIPAAYVSIGTLRRAAEGLSHYGTGFEKAPNENLVWQAIIMDRSAINILPFHRQT